MNQIFLTEPSRLYQKSFEQYALTYKKAGEAYYYGRYKKALEHFDEYITDLSNCSKGIDVPEDTVPTSTFWLVDGDEVVGVTRIRHTDYQCDGHIGYDISPGHREKGYGSAILKLALEKAAEIGIEEVIVTCSVSNTASKKIIEKNGGARPEIVFDEEENDYLYRYKIYNKKI